MGENKNEISLISSEIFEKMSKMTMLLEQSTNHEEVLLDTVLDSLVELPELEDLTWQFKMLTERLENADTHWDCILWLGDNKELNIFYEDNHFSYPRNSKLQNTLNKISKDIGDFRSKKIMKWYIEKL